MTAPVLFKEQAVLLGPRKSLVGIITQPNTPAPTSSVERPTVVLLNSGIVHRVGANRMSVTLARTLAAAGTPVIRFDLSGIGDSGSRSDGLAPLDSSLADIRDVLDSLTASRGTRRVILGGLCSGADHSILYASSDRRVVGVVLLDPSIPRTPRHYLSHYGKRLTEPESWMNLMRGKNPLWRKLRRRIAARNGPAGPSDSTSLETPAVRAFLEKAYGGAVKNDVQLLVVRTSERQYYREQLLDAFPRVPFGRHLRLEFFDSSDHMFTAPANRARVIQVIGEWVEHAAFSPGTAMAPE